MATEATETEPGGWGVLTMDEIEEVSELHQNYEAQLEDMQTEVTAKFSTTDVSTLPDSVLEDPKSSNLVLWYTRVTKLVDAFREGDWEGVAQYFEDLYDELRQPFGPLAAEKLPEGLQGLKKEADKYREFSERTAEAFPETVA